MRENLREGEIKIEGDLEGLSQSNRDRDGWRLRKKRGEREIDEEGEKREIKREKERESERERKIGRENYCLQPIGILPTRHNSILSGKRCPAF